MAGQKILYITTEMFPYQEDSIIAESVSKMAIKKYRDGNDVRVFMPRFGVISERKFQLHEVIRLSGMNIIINDLDQPLIIKVASLPGERLQVYFIDNEEYFKRKFFYFDEDETSFEDNVERAVFFARGVIETIKKLNWVPDIIHINGWMSSFVPIYLKTYYKKDYFFKNTKLVLSLYNEKNGDANKTLTKEVLKFDNIKNYATLEEITFSHFIKDAVEKVDVLVKGDEFLESNWERIYEDSTTEKFDYLVPEEIEKVY